MLSIYAVHYSVVRPAGYHENLHVIFLFYSYVKVPAKFNLKLVPVYPSSVI